MPKICKFASTIYFTATKHFQSISNKVVASIACFFCLAYTLHYGLLFIYIYITIILKKSCYVLFLVRSIDGHSFTLTLIVVVTVSIILLDCIGKMSSLKPFLFHLYIHNLSSSWQHFATVVNLYTVKIYKPHRPIQLYLAFCVRCYSSVYSTYNNK